MTSSQHDPRPGQDDTIGGDAREDSTQQFLESKDIVDQIFDFNEQVLKAEDVALNTLTSKQYDWTQKFCAEELCEFQEAYKAQDIVGMVDGIGDLIYGAMGTFKKMGLTREQVRAVFGAIHSANMTKKKGMTHRGSDEDAAKPADFVPPETAIGEILFGPLEAAHPDELPDSHIPL